MPNFCRVTDPSFSPQSIKIYLPTGSSSRPSMFDMRQGGEVLHLLICDCIPENTPI